MPRRRRRCCYSSRCSTCTCSWPTSTSARSCLTSRPDEDASPAPSRSATTAGRWFAPRSRRSSCCVTPSTCGRCHRARATSPATTSGTSRCLNRSRRRFSPSRRATTDPSFGRRRPLSDPAACTGYAERRPPGSRCEARPGVGSRSVCDRAGRRIGVGPRPDVPGRSDGAVRKVDPTQRCRSLDHRLGGHDRRPARARTAGPARRRCTSRRRRGAADQDHRSSRAVADDLVRTAQAASRPAAVRHALRRPGRHSAPSQGTDHPHLTRPRDLERAVMSSSTIGAAAQRWWFRPEPLARLALLRTLVYLYVPLDLYIRTASVVPHAYGSPDLYKPVDVLALLHQPAPSPWFVQTLRVVIIASSLLAALGLRQRTLGVIVALAYADWACLAMSYGKVDHDHLAILVAVAVLPTVSGAHWHSLDRSEAAGWALRGIEVAVVATYFLAAVAKMRFGGWHWPNGAIFTWAVVRRGTPLARPLLHHPLVLLLAQWALLLLEISTPAMLFVRQRWRTLAVVGLLSFHLVTWLTITINFAPLVVCLLAFLPLERVPTAARGLLRPRAVRRAASG